MTAATLASGSRTFSAVIQSAYQIYSLRTRFDGGGYQSIGNIQKKASILIAGIS
jgi:hypothetical protein